MKKIILCLMFLVNIMSMSWTITEDKDEFGDNNGQKIVTQNIENGILRLQKDGRALEFYISLNEYIGSTDNNQVKFKVDDNNPITLYRTNTSQDGTALWINNITQKNKFNTLIKQMKEGKILKIVITGSFYDYTKRANLEGFNEAYESIVK